MAATRTRRSGWIRSKKVHEYAYKTFVDREEPGRVGAKVGGWYGCCNRDGSLARSCVGGTTKGCFHVPRALLMCVQLVQEHSSSNGADVM